MKNLYISAMVLVLFLGILSCNNKSNETPPFTETFHLDTSKIEIFEINSSIRAISAIDENTMWFGGSKGMFGYTEDGGKSWNIDSIQHPDQKNLEFRSVSVTKDAVFLLSVASPALLFKSSDKGKNWKEVYKENDSLAFYDAMAFANDKVGLAMGDPTDGCLSVIKTEDGGETWKKISCSSIPAAIKGEAAFAASNSNLVVIGKNAWMVSGGASARVYHSGDLGETWKVYNTPIVQGGQMTGIFGSAFYDDKTGIIIGGDWMKMEENTGNKAVTNNGGKSWDLIADGGEPGYRSCAQYLSKKTPNHLLAVGIPGMSYSSNGGMTWEKISEESFYTTRIAGKVAWLAGSKKVARWPMD